MGAPEQEVTVDGFKKYRAIYEVEAMEYKGEFSLPAGDLAMVEGEMLEEGDFLLRYPEDEEDPKTLFLVKKEDFIKDYREI